MSRDVPTGTYHLPTLLRPELQSPGSGPVPALHRAQPWLVLGTPAQVKLESPSHLRNSSPWGCPSSTNPAEARKMHMAAQSSRNSTVKRAERQAKRKVQKSQQGPEAEVCKEEGWAGQLMRGKVSKEEVLNAHWKDSC